MTEKITSPTRNSSSLTRHSALLREVNSKRTCFTTPEKTELDLETDPEKGEITNSAFLNELAMFASLIIRFF